MTGPRISPVEPETPRILDELEELFDRQYERIEGFFAPYCDDFCDVPRRSGKAYLPPEEFSVITLK